MTDQDVDGAGPHDVVVRQLQELRRAAGEPSYAEIARWVGRLRASRGVPEASAAPPRTTVYDAFRLGRRRLDRELVADITFALDEEIKNRAAGASAEGSPDGPGVGLPVPIADRTPRHESPERREEPVATVVSGRSRRFVAVVLVIGILTNLVGQVVTTWLDLPIWQDMTGTAIAAITLGPWWGVLVAVVSMAIDTTVSEDTGFWFLPVAVAGALVWGYGTGRGRMARSTPRFLHLNVQVALASTILAVPITYWRFGGDTPHDSARITESLVEVLPSLVLAVVVSNLVLSLCDKLVSGFIALAVIDAFAADRPWLAERLRPQGQAVARRDAGQTDAAGSGD